MSTLDEVAAAAETVAAARAELLEAMIAAKQAGHPLRTIAGYARLSHQTVANMTA